MKERISSMSADRPIIDSRNIDFASLLGTEIRLKTEQFPNRMLQSKIISISSGNLVIDRSGSNGLVDQLIGKQEIEVQLVYRGQLVMFQSNISKPREERVQIPIAEIVTPIFSRQFERINMSQDVRLAYFDNASISSARLNKLKWLETRTVNISGGGMLVEIPANLSAEFYMIFQLALEDFDLPSLLLGRICHCNLGKDNRYQTGVEFITREIYSQKLPQILVRNLPPKLFTFNGDNQKDLDRFLTRQSEVVNQ